MAKKILIADDEADVLAILEKKLKQKEFEVLALSRGKEIIARAKEFQADLLVLDVIMPDSDGYEVGKQLRQDKEFRTTPIIYMTGKELEYNGMVRRTEELGYCDFVTKPCTFDELLEKIQKALE